MTEPDVAQIGNAVVSQLTRVLGVAPGVFLELIPDVISLDLLLFAPTPLRDSWVVCTLGASSRDMNVPQDMDDGTFWRRAEFVIVLPADFAGLDPDKGIVGGNDHFHPMALLKQVARCPHLAEIMVGPASTLQFEQPHGPDTSMAAVLLWWPSFAKTDDDAGVEVEDRSINFDQVIPIHNSESEHARQRGGDVLHEALTGISATQVFDLARAPLEAAA